VRRREQGGDQIHGTRTVGRAVDGTADDRLLPEVLADQLLSLSHLKAVVDRVVD
jgi:hypothetical protein